MYCLQIGAVSSHSRSLDHLLRAVLLDSRHEDVHGGVPQLVHARVDLPRAVHVHALPTAFGLIVPKMFVLTIWPVPENTPHGLGRVPGLSYTSGPVHHHPLVHAVAHGGAVVPAHQGGRRAASSPRS